MVGFPGFKIEKMITGLDLPVNLAFVKEPTSKPEDVYYTLLNLHGYQSYN